MFMNKRDDRSFSLARQTPLGLARAVSLKVALYTGIVVWTALSLFPLIWMYYNSLKSLGDFSKNRWLPPMEIRLQNYVEAWTGILYPQVGPKVGEQVSILPISRFFLNSVVVSSGSLLLALLLGSVAAYALARRPVPYSKAIMVTLIVALAIPSHALVLSIFGMSQELQLTGTYPGLILPYVAFALPFAILLLVAYYRTFPIEIEDAARIDGCSTLAVFWRIVLPMSKGPHVAIGVLLLNGFWNEFLYGLIMMTNSPLMKTLPAGLRAFAEEYHYTPYNVILAGLVVATTPIIVLFLIFQRQVTQGMDLGAVLKG